MSEAVRAVTMPLGVVVERRETGHRWQPVRFCAVDVLPDGPPADGWRELARGEGWVRWHAATLPLTLHRTETEGYRANLGSARPVVYVILRRAGAGPGQPVTVFRVTVSAYEAQDHLDSGDEMVDGVEMPALLRSWIEAFCAHHHVETPFVKRKRTRQTPADDGFARRPPVAERRRRRDDDG